MKQEIDPKETGRAKAFEMWMKSPVPMVTLTKTFDVTHLVRMSRRSGMKFNMLLCWCIGRAASRVPEFYVLPVDGKLFQYDCLAINVIVNNKAGSISLCDVPFSDDLHQFNADYLAITQSAFATCLDTYLDEAMAIGTSAVVETQLDTIVNQYSGIFNNPFLAWGRYRRHLFRYRLPISFQFHHTQMDGSQAAQFLEELKKTINSVNP